MLNITNETFLKAIFGDNLGFVHVTDFTHDPSNIPNDKILLAWMGNSYSKYRFSNTPSNQYFTISIFKPETDGKARRRKDLYLYTPVIVLDDVKEKLSLDAVKQLPPPSYILETSIGSEQWGYILDKPCTERYRTENLLDGLVANGLAPDGKDPGMKGVTRYVRLPDGCNNKKSKLVNGIPFKCRMLLWEPNTKTSLEALAKPLCVNLDKARKEHNHASSVTMPDHPILKTDIHIKTDLTNGRYDITCPWVDEHTGEADNGTAIWTNQDGSLGFKCHHGNCENRSRKDVLILLESKFPGFTNRYNAWQFKCLSVEGDNWKPTSEFMPQLVTETIPQKVKYSFLTSSKEAAPPVEAESDVIEDVLSQIKKQIPNTKESRELVSKFLRILEDLPKIDSQHYYQEICDYKSWTKNEFAAILKDLRKQWYEKESSDFYESVIFINDQNRLYDYNSKIFYSPDAFQNSFSHIDPNAKKNALVSGFVEKAEKMNFAPREPKMFIKNGVTYANGWNPIGMPLGKPGDCSQWLNHWDVLGWGHYRDHMLKFMAYTILKPENKINHMLLLGGGEGIGKDFLLYPLSRALDDYSTVVSGNELLSDFNDYLFFTKHLHVNEIELGDHKKASEVSAKLKPLAAAPPDTLRVNLKGVTPIKVQNIVNVTMSTNSKTPLKLSGVSRRFYAMWTDLNIRDEQDEMFPEWVEYWQKQWHWLKNGGVDHCIYYLRNHVDISDFNPGAVPKMTEFLREIKDSSKSPAQQTIEAFIEHRIGAFGKDLATVNELCLSLKGQFPNADQFMYIDNSWFAPNKIAKILNDVTGCSKLRARGNHEVRLWALRNAEKYKNMSMSERFITYENQSKGGV
jgi:hypothetical protein